MFLTVHSTIGALIGQNVSTPLVAFIFGYISHWLIDAIPHGDENLIPKNFDKKQRIKRLFVIGAIDLLGSLLVLTILSRLTLFNLNMVVASIGAITPDILWGFSSLLPKKTPWEFLNSWHNKIHWLFKTQISFKLGIVIQLLVLALTVWIILR